MAWTNLTFAYGSVLTSAKMTQMYDNFSALATGASGAPTITTNAATATNLTGASAITSSLGADVLCNNITLYFDGPTIAQGSTGTWFVSGSITVYSTVSACNWDVKLWDGSTVIDSGEIFTPNSSGGIATLCGYISSPTGNIRISVKNLTSNGYIKFNLTGNSKDSTISAFRIA